MAMDRILICDQVLIGRTSAELFGVPVEVELIKDSSNPGVREVHIWEGDERVACLQFKENNEIHTVKVKSKD